MLKYLDFPKGISLVYGGPATGKSTLCFQLVASNPGKVIFIDTENSFNIERIQQMNPLFDLNNLILFHASRYSEQYAAVKSLKNVKNIDLVIVDSFTHYYRKKLQDGIVIRPPTIKMLDMLKQLEVPVLLTSQVYSMDGKTHCVAGDLFERFSSYILVLDSKETAKGLKRNLVIEGTTMDIPFIITDKGLSV
ncbi:MAG: AAA family ATPase [Nanoarchaeota archaeon]|nr:AAA family ATPase [Nanoarchaeota archaeon]